ncbi:MAG: NYN domain-containing protein [Candidatus Kapabacteria bacterium]|nr:NYN domain-containing protein [Candidatus Kapabacteria bacterium]
MALLNTSKLTRIGVFYDGNYFLHVSNYYAFNHARNSRISLRGLHDFIRAQVGIKEGEETRLCQIVDSHFFRGRISANEAQTRGNLLYYDRVFEDILMWEGVITHYLPIRNSGGRREEKGIDVWMALEAYELTLLKQFDVVVLITSDGDYVPLVRKLNNLGARVMVLSWDFEFEDNEGKHVVTRTSQELLEEVTYPISMHEIIENRAMRNDPIVQNLFVKRDEAAPRQAPFVPELSFTSAKPDDRGPREFTSYQAPRSTRAPLAEPPGVVDDSVGERLDGYVLALKNGYGFIKYPPNNLFFHVSDLLNADFPDLQEGDPVEFNIGYNREGEEVAKNVKLMLDDIVEDDE